MGSAHGSTVVTTRLLSLFVKKFPYTSRIAAGTPADLPVAIDQLRIFD
jgi:hypothetical protein